MPSDFIAAPSSDFMSDDDDGQTMSVRERHAGYGL